MFDKNYKVIIDTHFIIQWIIYFLLLVCVVYLIRNGVQNGIKKTIRLNPGITGEKVIAVYNDKVVLSSENSITEFKIPAIKSVEEVKDYYIIETFNLMSIILPKKVQGLDLLIKELKDIMKISVC